MKNKKTFLCLSLLLLFLLLPTFCFAEYWSVVPVKGTRVNARMNHTAVLDTTQNYMFLFGGREYTGSFYTTSKEVYLGYQTDSEFTFNLFPTFGDPIPEREDQSAVIYSQLSANPTMIVCGGRDRDAGKQFGDIFHLDLVTHQWSQITTFSGAKPVPLYGHSAVWSPTLNSMLLFGGYDTTGQVSDKVYLYNPWGPSWSLITTMGFPTTCPARAEHSAVIVGKQMFVYGGFDGNIYRGDLWKLDLSTFPYYWTQLTPAGSPPQPRANHSMVFDSDLGRILLFGGRGGAGFYNDVYALDTSGLFWSQVTVRTMNPPIIREGQSAVYDLSKRRMLIFGGGQDVPAFDDMWELFLAIAPVSADIGVGGGILSAGSTGRYRPTIIIPPFSLPGAAQTLAPIHFTIGEAEDNHAVPSTVAIEPSGTIFNADTSAILVMEFTPQDVPADSTPDMMRIYTWDTALGDWVKIPYRQLVDTTLNTVTVPLYHLSDFGVMSGHTIPTVEATTTVVTSFGGLAQVGTGGTYNKHACSFPSGALASATDVGASYPPDDHGWSSFIGTPPKMFGLFSGNSAVVQFSPETTLLAVSIITVEYKDSDVVGGTESQMKIHWWNQSALEWQVVAGTQTVNTVNNTVSVGINRLGIYGAAVPLLADVDQQRWELYQ
jgi:hypothetical protein